MAVKQKNEADKLYEENYNYPPSEDIFNKGIKVDLNPEDIFQEKKIDFKHDLWNEKDFNENRLGADLGVPGSELDDDQENVGSKDEENNYYSTGGDAHNNLEETNEY